MVDDYYYLFLFIVRFIAPPAPKKSSKMSSLFPYSLSRLDGCYLEYTAACGQKFDKSVLIGFIFFGVQSLTRYDGRWWIVGNERMRVFFQRWTVRTCDHLWLRSRLNTKIENKFRLNDGREVNFYVVLKAMKERKKKRYEVNITWVKSVGANRRCSFCAEFALRNSGLSTTTDSSSEIVVGTVVDAIAGAGVEEGTKNGAGLTEWVNVFYLNRRCVNGIVWQRLNNGRFFLRFRRWLVEFYDCRTSWPDDHAFLDIVELFLNSWTTYLHI